MEEEIDSIKGKLSTGKSRFENGNVLVEVSLSDLNELFSLTYDINNYRLNCLWNWEKTSEACKEYEECNEKYKQALMLIHGVTNGISNPAEKDINRIVNKALGFN